LNVINKVIQKDRHLKHSKYVLVNCILLGNSLYTLSIKVCPGVKLDINQAYSNGVKNVSIMLGLLFLVLIYFELIFFLYFERNKIH
jgi:hypothetical protein